LNEAAEDAADANVDFEDMEDVTVRIAPDGKRDISDANDFAALGINDLLIQEIADDPEHVLIRVIREELLIFEVNAVQRNGADLIVPNAEPRPAAADEKTVDTSGIYERNDRGVADAADLAAPRIVDLKAHEFGAEK
jgi:hypothetical protein